MDVQTGDHGNVCSTPEQVFLSTAEDRPCDSEHVTVRIDDSLEGIDWARAKAELAADDFDNGR